MCRTGLPIHIVCDIHRALSFIYVLSLLDRVTNTGSTQHKVLQKKDSSFCPILDIRRLNWMLKNISFHMLWFPGQIHIGFHCLRMQVLFNIYFPRTFQFNPGSTLQPLPSTTGVFKIYASSLLCFGGQRHQDTAVLNNSYVNKHQQAGHYHCPTSLHTL